MKSVDSSNVNAIGATNTTDAPNTTHVLVSFKPNVVYHYRTTVDMWNKLQNGEHSKGGPPSIGRSFAQHFRGKITYDKHDVSFADNDSLSKCAVADYMLEETGDGTFRATPVKTEIEQP